MPHQLIVGEEVESRKRRSLGLKILFEALLNLIERSVVRGKGFLPVLHQALPEPKGGSSRGKQIRNFRLGRTINRRERSRSETLRSSIDVLVIALDAKRG